MHVNDEYARKHMAAEGDALFFDKKHWPRWFNRLIGGAMIAASCAVVGGAVVDAKPELLVALLPISFSFVAQLSFSTLRTMVTRRFVHIQYGLFGPKIPIEDFISADVVDYDWKKYGGFGIRYSIRDGSMAYNMMGDQGRAVKLVYRAKGKETVLLVSADDPERLCAAIAEARATSTSAPASSLSDVRLRLGVQDAPPPATPAAKQSSNITRDEQMPEEVRERIAAAQREKP